ncbi:MAG: hypothetical protein WA004_12070 [Saprospiraceae bacterium]
MKTIINTVLLMTTILLLPTSLSGQIQKGSSLIGGTASLQIGAFEFFGEYGEDMTSISLKPQLIAFFTDQFGFGGTLQLEYMSFYGESITTVGFTPTARYYLNSAGNIRPFAFAYLGYSRAFYYGEGLGQGVFGLGFGLDFFLNQNIAFEAIAAYDRTQIFYYEEGFGSFGLSIGVVAFLSSLE